MTLIEVALASTLVVGLSAGIMMTLRMHQMVKLGEAAGEQLAQVDEGVGRYLAQNGAAVAALPSACAQVPYVSGFQIGADPGQMPDLTSGACQLKINGETIQNGFQPTVQELVKLNYVRASGDLMLPYRDDVTDLSTGQKAPAQLAVSISVAEGPSDGGTGTGGGTGSGAGGGTVRPIATFTGGEGKMAVEYGSNGELTRVYDVDCSDTQSTVVKVIKAQKLIFENSGKAYCDYYKSNGHTPTWEVWEREYPGTLSTLYGVDCNNNNPPKLGSGLSYASGTQFCKDYQRAAMPASLIQQLQAYWAGASGTTGTVATLTATGSTAKPNLRLHSLVYNAQPYHAGNTTLPFGAAAQMASALHAAGYKGRLIMPGTKPEDSLQLTGLQGTQSVRNPITTADGVGAQSGILAAESWYYLNGSTTTPIGSGGGGGVVSSDSDCGALSQAMCRDGSTTPTSRWDFNQNDLSNVGTLSARTIKSPKVSLLDNPGSVNTKLVRPENALDTDRTVLEVRGNLQMNESSTLAADYLYGNNIYAKRVGSPEITAPDLSRVGSYQAKGGTLFIHNNAGIRLPHAVPGTPCDGNNMSDVALSYPGKLALKAGNRHPSIVTYFPENQTTDLRDNLNHTWRRFILHCGGLASSNPASAGESIWRNSEYEALTKTNSAKYLWIWQVDAYHTRDSDQGYEGRQSKP